MDVPMLQHHLLKRLSLFHWILFTSLSKTSWLGWVYFRAIFYTLFHRTTCPFFQQYHIVLIIIALQQFLKLGSIKPLILFFNIMLGTGSSAFQFNNIHKIICCGFKWDCIESVDVLGRTDILTIFNLLIHKLLIFFPFI